MNYDLVSFEEVGHGRFALRRIGSDLSSSLAATRARHAVGVAAGALGPLLEDAPARRAQGAAGRAEETTTKPQQESTLGTVNPDAASPTAPERHIAMTVVVASCGSSGGGLPGGRCGCATPCTTPPAAKLHRCFLFPADNIWNAPMNTLSLDSHSDAYVA